ncbi:MAG: DegV family protein [Oscillospiraceae bacterium]|jgi:DegV family protein with EDD domain|nr:DegV family protein [Oscillospiraceae bacterium]
MSDFVITADTGADLNKYFKKKFDTHFVKFPCFLNEKPFDSTDHAAFYNGMRSGVAVSTSQINTEEIRNFFEPFLKDGFDIVHVSFSSALSGSFSCCCAAREALMERYPDRRISVIDSKAAASGQGLLYAIALQMQCDGKTFEEIVTWLEQNVYHLHHLFTVDNLSYLQRGGRISKTTAVVGAVLGVKPLLLVDAEGRLQLYSKTRGRRRSLDTIVGDISDYLSDIENKFMFISHADCQEDAEYCAKLIRKTYRCEVYIADLVPVIGAHSGPGTVHIAFLGKRLDF